MKALTSTERRDLRARAHGLDPVVSIAEKGLAPSVLKEIDRSLTAHELIKIRVFGDDRDARQAYLTNICAELDCAPVQMIGKLLVVYRPSPDKDKAADKASPTRPAVATPRAGRSAAPRTSVARPATKLKSSVIARSIAGPRSTATSGNAARKPRGR